MVAAAIVAVGTVFTGIFGFVGPIVAAEVRLFERTCAVVVREYREIVATDPSMVDALTAPRWDGKSILDSDGAAVGCGVDVSALRDLRP